MFSVVGTVHIPSPPPLFAAMYLAYKYIRDKRRKAKAAREAEAAGLPPPLTQTRPADNSVDADAQSTPKSSGSPPASTQKKGFHISPAFKWQLMLCAALLVPVFFETLDYTGTSCS